MPEPTIVNGESIKVPNRFAQFNDIIQSSTVLSSLDGFLLTSEDDKEKHKTFTSRSPAKQARKDGEPVPTGPFAEFTVEQLAKEIALREAGETSLGGLSGFSDGDIYLELRNRSEALGIPAVGENTPAQNLAGAKNVLKTEQAAATQDAKALQAAGLLGQAGAIDTPLLGGLEGINLTTQIGRKKSQQDRAARLVDANNRQARRTGGTSPRGEALRRAGSAPVRLGSAPKSSGSTLGQLSPDARVNTILGG